jgi:hypothetical protein
MNLRRQLDKSRGSPKLGIQSEEGGTKPALEVEHSIPVPLLGNLAEAVIIKQNDREMDTMLANLKARMEA